MSVQLSSPVATVPYIRRDGVKRRTEIFYCNAPSPDKLGLGYETPSEGDFFYIVRGWYKNKTKLYDVLREEVDWSETYVKLYGKVHKSPRLVHFMGDVKPDQSRTHNYSSYAHPIKRWHPAVRWIRNSLKEELGIRYDSSLLNFYQSGTDYIAYHGDKEVTGSLQSVAAVSLGGTRRFYLKSNQDNSVIKTELHAGDLVIMTGDLQQTHKHSVPKQSGVNPRISITFRILMDN